MDTKPSNPPAFPMTSGVHTDDEGATIYTGPEGMTLRDYFAAKAHAALIMAHPDWKPSLVASKAYEMADALLRTREAK